ncbi:helix-turn-helix domain-containing protein [Chloroflexota bacterium]
MSKSKVYKMIQRGEIPSMNLGRNVRIRRTDVIDWIMEELIENTVKEPTFNL